MKKSYKIEVDCPNCAAKMERAAKKVPGVLDATVNFMTLKMSVELLDDVDEIETMKAVSNACRRASSGCRVFF